MKLLGEFCEQTTLHGFGFVTKSRFLVETICWGLFILTCIALTVKDTVTLIALYLSEPTAFQIEMAYDNQARRFPDATVCAQIDRCSVATLINETTFAQVLKQFTESNQPNLLKSGNISAAKNASIDPSIIAASYILVAEMMDFDRALTAFGPCLTGFQCMSCAPEFVAANYTNEVEMMSSYYSTNKFDILSLTKMIASLTCYMMKFGVFYRSIDIIAGTDSAQTLDICGGETIVWFGPPPYLFSPFDTLCTKISPAKSDLFTNPTDSMTITWSPTSLMSPLATSMPNMMGYSYTDLNAFFDVAGGEGVLDYKIPQTTFVKIAVGLRPQASLSTGAIINQSSLPNQMNGFDVRLESAYTALNLSRAPCVNETQFQCRQACIAQNIAAQRGCWPLAYTWIQPASSTLGACTGRFEYTGNGSISAAGSPFNQSIWSVCENECGVEPCSINTYAFFPSQNGQPAYIYPNGVVYENITEFITMDIVSLLVQFGGSIGLWLGGSILAFVHVPIYFIGIAMEWLCSSHRKRTKNTDDLTECVTVSAVEMSEIRADYSRRAARF